MTQVKLLDSGFWNCSHRHIRTRLKGCTDEATKSALRKISIIRTTHYFGLYATALIVVLTLIGWGPNGLRSLNQSDFVAAIFSVLQIWCGLIIATILGLILRSTSIASATLLGVPIGLILAGIGASILSSQALGETMTYFVSSLFIWIGICFPAYVSFAILKEKIISEVTSSDSSF